MPTFEIICLAKSIKYGGTCIAGMKTDGSGWLRPVSNQKNGTLHPEHYTLDNGSEPKIFDIIRIPCVKPEPKCHQPENWLIKHNQLWENLGNPTLNQARQLLNPEIKKQFSSAELLGNLDKEISYEELNKSAAQSSLALVKPNQIKWQITRHNYQNEKKFRAIFLLVENLYNLPITDPIWIDKLKYLEEGIYSCEEVIQKLELKDFEPDKFTLTISLGEPFQPLGQEKEFCYKLVAAVINVADIKKRFGWS
ncbi:hypothetical protein [uncultured Nostoc sp.]|uniref:dual OB domain-containing protein n=1 Tax=uncultured Nostoc sp. TaxID=340711 RepID=UPI0035CA272B